MRKELSKECGQLIAVHLCLQHAQPSLFHAIHHHHCSHHYPQRRLDCNHRLTSVCLQFCRHLVLISKHALYFAPVHQSYTLGISIANFLATCLSSGLMYSRKLSIYIHTNRALFCNIFLLKLLLFIYSFFSDYGLFIFIKCMDIVIFE